MCELRNAAILVISLGCCLVTCDRLDAQSVISFDFTNLPFPTGTILTTEFRSDGIIFSDDDSGMDPLFPCPSLPGMENFVQNGQLMNLFRIEFSTTLPVIEVVARFRDANTNPQIHELFALDADLQIVRSVSYDDSSAPLSQFELSLYDADGMAGIAACELPLGAERFLSLVIVTADPIFSDGFETGDTTSWSNSMP